MAKIEYDEKTKQWHVRNYKGKRYHWTFSVNNYGIYAEKLAKRCLERETKIRNYIEYGEEFSILKLYSKTYGYQDIKISNESIKLIETWDSKFGIKTLNGNLHYPCDKEKNLLHRVILGLSKGDTDIVDHKNGDILDCRIENLRITDTKTNNINHHSIRSNTGFLGVSARPDVGKVHAYIGNSKDKQYKTFMISNYSTIDEAIQEAVKWRNEMEEKLGYKDIKE